jgi:hypothetical protein
MAPGCAGVTGVLGVAGGGVGVGAGVGFFGAELLLLSVEVVSTSTGAIGVF